MNNTPGSRCHPDASTPEPDASGQENAGELELKIERLEKINAALVARAEEMQDSRAGPFALFRANVELQHKVRERTEELSRSLAQIQKMNQQLLEAKNQAEQANRSKTRFLAQAGHDLLQPVTSARLTLSAFQENKLAPDDQRLVRQVERSLETIEVSLRALLDISRLDSGASVPDIRPIALGAVFADLEQDFAPIAARRGLRWDVLPTSAVVATDAAMLMRVLQNLIGNALRYTKKGRVLLGTRLRRDWVRIDVLDNGPGIDKTQFEAIFEEFHRGRIPAQEGEIGLGLGLSIVQRLADVLGHRLTLQSDVGRGSRFSIELPRIADEVAITPPPQALAATAEEWHCAGKTVVVIENDEDVRRAVMELITRWKCVAFQCSGSSDAIVAAATFANDPDLLIVDYHLDNETALDAIVRFEDAFGKRIPAIVMTASRSAEISERVSKAGFKMLHKPINVAHLRYLIENSETLYL